jgi:hypothetical protein
MNKNLSTLSELTHENKPKHSGRFFKNNDWQNCFIAKKIMTDHMIYWMKMKRSLYLKDGKLLLMKLNHFYNQC